jgi:hypothetical protein
MRQNSLSVVMTILDMTIGVQDFATSAVQPSAHCEAGFSLLEPDVSFVFISTP